MKVYAVFKDGVYRHECGGIFTDVEAAKKIAGELHESGDKYHDFQVVPFDLDVPVPRLYPRSDSLDEPEEVYRATKETASKKRKTR